MSLPSAGARRVAGAGGSSPQDDRRRLHRTHRTRTLSSAARHAVDTLERRVLLAVDFFGTAGPDTITVAANGTGTEMTVTINGSPNVVPVTGTDLINIFAGDGNDTIIVESTEVPLSISGEGGDDTLALAPTGQNLDPIESEVEFIGGDGNDSAIVIDRANSFNDNFEVHSDEIFRGFFGGLVYSQLEALTLNTGSAVAVGSVGGGGNASRGASPRGLSVRGGFAPDGEDGSNTIDVVSLSAETALVINAGGGDDTINFSPFGLLLDDIAGPVTVNGEAGEDSINVFDQNNAFPDAYDVTANHVSREIFGGVTYQTVESLRVSAGLFSSLTGGEGGPEGGGDHVFNVASLSVPTTLNGGAGNDEFIVGSGGQLAPLLALLIVNGQSGIDILTVDDTLNPANDSYRLSATDFQRNGAPVVNYATIERVRMRLGDGNNTVEIASVDAGVPVTLFAGAGDDTINLTSGDLDPIESNVTIDGEAGNDALFVNDDAVAVDRDYTITDRAVTVQVAPASVSFTYINLEGVTLRATTGANSIAVDETDPLTPVTILSNAGSDSVQINSNGSGTAEAVFAGVEELASLSINTGGRARIAPSAAGTNVLRLGELVLTGTGVVDITNNNLILDYSDPSPISTVRSLIGSGYSGGTWTGAGVTSSTAAATPNHGVGYAEASALFTTFPATFAGQSVDNTTILVRYTRYGDANLDRLVNLQDFNRLAASFGSGSLWSQGNFNFDGQVNLADFNRLAANFGQSVSAAEDDV